MLPIYCFCCSIQLAGFKALAKPLFREPFPKRLIGGFGMVRVAINGFGRIGRLVLRAGIDSKKIEWVAINGVRDAKAAEVLFRYDSVHGKFEGSVEGKGNELVVN